MSLPSKILHRLFLRPFLSQQFNKLFFRNFSSLEYCSQCSSVYLIVHWNCKRSFYWMPHVDMTAFLVTNIIANLRKSLYCFLARNNRKFHNLTCTSVTLPCVG